MKQHDFERIATAIAYIQEHFREQPDLDEVAAHVNLSPFHFQRLFSNWAGVSPKKFLQYTSIEYAKRLLGEQQASLFDTALETGLSGTGRLHDLFVNLEGMTPGEYKNGGELLIITYRFAETIFGNALIAATPKGLCNLMFITNEEDAFAELTNRFPKARFINGEHEFHQQALQMLNGLEIDQKNPIRLHLKGTAFQLKVWQALLQIPSGELSSYGKLASAIEQPTASRAVGTAIGDNPIAYLIPCHRVLQTSGKLGGYRWGTPRKSLMIGWEAVKINNNIDY
ncbi:MAG: methylated-DNA--[protein]-cysteine S-methyltransferase [Flavobacteriia bacterium]|nr:methylated-DNA--[protein]-cysteine S-methyltransferase [Flavobacteriia bacterium]